MMTEQEASLIQRATFVARPNRFVSEIRLEGASTTVRAHMPNPGRMWELLFPGVCVYVLPHRGGPEAKTAYRLIGVEREGTPILLDTHYSNEVAAWLVATKKIPGWESYHVARREVKVGHSRFDLLLENDAGEGFLVEVKSCTLFSKHGAMFPDAITERGRKHMLELAELQHLAASGELVSHWESQGLTKEAKALAHVTKAGFLILVHWGQAQWFLPDYHTDLAFSRTFLEVSSVLDWKAIALAWSDTFTTATVAGQCAFSRALLEKECDDRGDYIVILRLPESKTLSIGSKGPMTFPAGYYLYVGSAKANLTKRLARHQRRRKQKHWHLDYFRNACEWVAAVPIRSSSDLECELAKALSAIAQWRIPGFGCSDCHCESHLFGMEENPVHDRAFMAMVEDFRMNRLDDYMKEC